MGPDPNLLSCGRNASRCWSKEEASSAQTCHTPYIAYKLRVLHTFWRIFLACQFLKVAWLLLLLQLLLLLCCLAYVVDFCHSATGKKCKGQREGGRGNGMVCSKREMHKNLLRFILPHAKDAPSCHSQQQKQQLFQRAAVVTALESCRGLPLTVACFTPHMPVYLWCCLWLWLRCAALCWAFKRLKVCTQFLLCHIPDTCCAASTSTLLVVFLTGWVRCSASAYAELKYKLSMQVGQMLPQRGTWA